MGDLEPGNVVLLLYFLRVKISWRDVTQSFKNVHQKFTTFQQRRGGLTSKIIEMRVRVDQ